MRDLLYDTDFFTWTQETATKIRDGRFHAVDLSAVAEEIEDLGKRDWTEVNSRLRVIITHLLKLDYQPEKKTDSLMNSIGRERTELEGIFDQSPNLIEKAKPAEDLYSCSSRGSSGNKVAEVHVSR